MTEQDKHLYKWYFFRVVPIMLIVYGIIYLVIYRG